MEENYIDYHTLSARVKISMENDQTRQNNITAFLRMKKDSIIWISIRPLLGIEMIRVMLTPDSIKLINNLKQTVYLRNADAISSMLHMPLDFDLLQNLLIGNPAFIPDKLSHFKTDSSSIYLTIAKHSVYNRYKWSLSDFLLENSHSWIKDSSRYADQQYSAYRPAGPYLFSFDRKIRIRSGDQTRIQIRFEKVDFNQEVHFPFHYSPRYKIL